MTGRQPDGVPSAFRRQQASFVGHDDAQVLKLAASALMTAQRLPLHSRGRAEQWSRFDDAMSELTARGIRHVLAKLRECGELAGGEVIPDEPQ